MSVYRYIVIEVMKPFFFMTFALLILLIATEISDTLTKVLTGQLSDNAIWIVVGYQIPILLAEILPASFFLASITTLHRLNQDSERAVIHAFGVSDENIRNCLLLFAAFPVFLVALSLNNFVEPRANKNLAVFLTEQKNRPITDIIDANTFHRLESIDATFFAAEIDTKNERLLDVFTVKNNDNSSSVITAASAKTSVQNDAQQFKFTEGQIANYSFDENTNSEIQRFDQLTVNVIENGTSRTRLRRNSLSTSSLIESNYRADHVEVANRLIKPLYIPLFCILAVALTRYKPRHAKVGAIALGIFLYVLINFSYRTVSSAVGKSDLTIFLMPWWFLVAIALIATVFTKMRNA